MEKVSVFDLDGTLVPYDSYRRCIREFLGGEWRERWRLGLWLLGRRTGVLSQARIKEMVIRRLACQANRELFESFAGRVANDLGGVALELLYERKAAGDSIVILSASPDDYVKLLGERLECVAQGSYFDRAGKFIHLRGETKLSWLYRQYPMDRVIYSTAVSDCASDLKLLHAFQHGYLYDGFRLVSAFGTEMVA